MSHLRKRTLKREQQRKLATIQHRRSTKQPLWQEGYGNHLFTAGELARYNRRQHPTVEERDAEGEPNA